jgi:phage terminase Nu1 subunit (DNA packaging protein)
MDAVPVAQAIIEIRRTARELLDPAARRRAEQAAERLAAELEPTISKTRAARLLGVSVTALDKWVARGRVPVGRKSGLKKTEIDTATLLELAEDVAELREQGRRRGLISEALRRRAERRRSTASILETAALIEAVSAIAAAPRNQA